MDKVPWNRVIYKEFVSLSYLTKEEERILKTRIAGWNQAAQIDELNISLATLNRRIRKLKDKYEYLHKRDIAKAEKVATLQNLYKK